jgi:hypothetical protein
LNLGKRPDKYAIPNGAPIQVYRVNNFYTLSEFNIPDTGLVGLIFQLI